MYPIGVTDTTSKNQREVRDQVNHLKKLGHAISYDSTEDSEMKFLSSRVLHYRSCKLCKKNGEADAV